MCGLGVVVGYALVGATWLIMKAEGPLHDRARRIALGLLPILVAFLVIVAIWTPLEHPVIAQRWFGPANLSYLLPILLLTAALTALLWRELARGGERSPFPLAIAIFAVCFLGLGFTLYPYAVPFDLTIWDAAASRASQEFLLVGVAIMLPVVLFYTGYNYWVFRGKVSKATAYQ
jgi:cytochrome d ubiquinol oxidase subunit II